MYIYYLQALMQINNENGHLFLLLFVKRPYITSKKHEKYNKL